jgi:YcxB-like protein
VRTIQVVGSERALAMSHEVTLRYNEPLLRRAVVCFWWRTVGPGYVIAQVILAACLVWLMLNGDRSWLSGALAMCFVMGIAVPVAVFVVHYRNSMRKFRAMGEPEATFTAGESSFSLASRLGSSTAPWSAITEVWQFPTFWLLFFSRAQFSTVPLADITPETKAFILERVEASGGKIR